MNSDQPIASVTEAIGVLRNIGSEMKRQGLHGSSDLLLEAVDVLSDERDQALEALKWYRVQARVLGTKESGFTEVGAATWQLVLDNGGRADSVLKPSDAPRECQDEERARIESTHGP